MVLYEIIWVIICLILTVLDILYIYKSYKKLQKAKKPTYAEKRMVSDYSEGSIFMSLLWMLYYVASWADTEMVCTTLFFIICMICCIIGIIIKLILRTNIGKIISETPTEEDSKFFRDDED